MVRTGPDVHEDQGPEVHDRQAVGVDRTASLLGHEVVHHAKEASGEEEAHGVVAVPPLRQRILHAREGGVALDAEEGHRNSHVVHEVKHGDGDDHRQVEPVGHVDVGFLAGDQRAEKDEKEGDPDHCEPQVNIPFGFGVFAALGDAQEIAGGGQDNEELVAPEHEGRKPAAPETGARGALHDIEGRADQRVAAEREDHCGRVQRAQASEIEEGLNVECGPRELRGHEHTDQKAGRAPEERGDDPPADDIVIISCRIRRQGSGASGAEAHAAEHEHGAECQHRESDPEVDLEESILP